MGFWVDPYNADPLGISVAASQTPYGTVKAYIPADIKTNYRASHPNAAGDCPLPVTRQPEGFTRASPSADGTACQLQCSLPIDGTEGLAFSGNRGSSDFATRLPFPAPAISSNVTRGAHKWIATGASGKTLG